MKKLIFLIFTFLCGVNIAYAANHIYNIDIDVYLNEYGDANITERWTVKGSDGTEWYKVLGNLGNSKLSDFTVSMDGNPLTYKKWDVDESLSKKSGYYGINYKSGNTELCFGKYDYKKHVFTLNYKLSNFVFNTKDSQVIYFKFIDKSSKVDFDDFTLKISTFYEIPDTLDVWGYGYKGYAYVENGKIKMSNEGDMDGKYVVLLAKFPINTFKTNNKYSKFSTFDDVYSAAEKGSFKNNSFSIFSIIGPIISFGIWLLVIIGIVNAAKNLKYGYIDNKTINKNNTPYFRDIPCNKDIYFASTLANLNNISKETNILGAIFLKWIKAGVLSVRNEKNTSLVLNGSNSITNPIEIRLYDMVYQASKDGILEKNELEKWARRNYSRFLDLFTRIKNDEIIKLNAQNHIFKRENKKQCKYKNVMDDYLYNESQKLYGLKLFLDDFSNMNQREAIEVSLWNEYLMFAYIFGSAKKVMKQFKDLYPEIITEMQSYNLDFDTLYFLNNISYSSVSAASSARSAAESYSSGGGGFSSGGGGGGSFGGGGGGSR